MKRNDAWSENDLDFTSWLDTGAEFIEIQAGFAWSEVHFPVADDVFFARSVHFVFLSLDFVIWLAVGSPCEDEEKFIYNESKDSDDAEKRNSKDEEKGADGPDDAGADDLDGKDLCVKEAGEFGDNNTHAIIVNSRNDTKKKESKNNAADSDGDSHVWISLFDGSARCGSFDDAKRSNGFAGVDEAVNYLIGGQKCEAKSKYCAHEK